MPIHQVLDPTWGWGTGSAKQLRNLTNDLTNHDRKLYGNFQRDSNGNVSGVQAAPMLVISAYNSNEIRAVHGLGRVPNDIVWLSGAGSYTTTQKARWDGTYIYVYVPNGPYPATVMGVLW